MRLFGAAFALALLLTGTSPAGEPTPVERLRAAEKLLAGGRPQQALDLVDRLRQDLPPDAKLFAWRSDYPKAQLLRVLTGRRRVFVVVYQSRTGRMPAGVTDDRAPLNETNTRYDFNEVIVCLDSATGERLWVRRTAGRMGLAVDPLTDDLYCWRDYRPYAPPHVFRLDAKTGELTLDKTLPRPEDRLQGLLVRGIPIMDSDRGSREDVEHPTATLYNVTTEKVEVVDWQLRLWIGPDEKSRLVPGPPQPPSYSRTIERRTLGGQSLWKYSHYSFTHSDPFWHGGDVVVPVGNPADRSAIVRLGGTTGEPVWRFPLPRGLYLLQSDHLAGQYDSRDTWDACQLSGGRLVAVGGGGTVFFLDPKTGGLQGSFRPSRTHVAFPRVTEDAVLVCTKTHARAVPLAVALSTAEVDERHAVTVQAKCLDALGRTKEAAGLLGGLLEQFPTFVPAVQAQADLYAKLGRTAEEVGLRCQLLHLLGRETDETLRDRFGLVKRIDAGQPITTDLVLSGDTLLAGTMGGLLYEIDARQLDVIRRQEFDSTLSYLTAQAEVLAYRPGRSELKIDKAEPPRTLPGERGVTGYDGHLVRHAGKYYRPLQGGTIRFVGDDGLVEKKTKLKDIEKWAIYSGPGGPLGYGTLGVYKLDGDLCPTDYLVKLSDLDIVPKQYYVAELAADGHALAALVYTGTTRLQVWTTDGKQKLRDIDLEPYGYLYRLRALPGGYLLTGHSVVWVPADPGRLVLPFFPKEVPDPTDRFGRSHQGDFGNPVVAGNYLFLGHEDGGIYVFDLAHWLRHK